MKKANYLIYFLLLLIPAIVIVTGCSKKKKYKLSGIIYNECNEPVGEITIDVRQRSTAFVDYTGGSLKSFKTNKDGTFEYNYKTLDNGSTPLAVFAGTAPDAAMLMSGIPANSDEVVNIYLKKTVNLTFTLNFDTFPIPKGDSLYTKFDTLYLGGNKFKGTFRNGQVIGPISVQQDVNFYGWENKVYSLCWGIRLPDYLKSLVSLGRYNEYKVIRYKMLDCDVNTNINVPLK
jgi:hypothetical protein